MAKLSDNVLDAACSYLIANGEDVHICTQEPANYTEASSTYSVGNKTGVTLTGPANGDVSGRKATIPAITDGTVTATDTATHWALVKASATSDLLAAQTLASGQAVTSGNTWTMGATDIEFPDPA